MEQPENRLITNKSGITVRLALPANKIWDAVLHGKDFVKEKNHKKKHFFVKC